MKLYLLIDLLAIAVPLIASFHPKLYFYKTWPALFTAIVCIAIPFLLLDAIFTTQGIWSFNPAYVTGIYVFNLPIEEVLFFVCIPYACVFTYYCLNRFYNLSWTPASENIFCLCLSGLLLVTGLLFWKRWYTSSTFTLTAAICVFLKFGLRVKWFGKAVSVYGLLLLPFFIVNGILTGTGPAQPVVSYNPGYNLGIRILTIPIEDFFYGFTLYLGNLLIYLRLIKMSGRSIEQAHSA